MTSPPESTGSIDATSKGDDRAGAAGTLGQAFTLPNGQVIKNRILKSAMSETLAPGDGRVPPTMATLYERWARGGVGLSVTGNVMIDRGARGEPGNVVIEDERDLSELKRWAQAGQVEGSKIWMQINHPGRQAPGFLNKETVSASDVPVKIPGFHRPRALSEAEIESLIQRFGRTAKIAEAAGFDGAQIHGAHGYLVSQFLSPLTNKRTDKWGGSAENRRRFALEIYREMRRQTSPEFGVSIKINSADFQKGGISNEASTDTIVALAEAGMDFVEISGGTYEAPAMMSAKDSTRKREAYFLEFGEALRTKTSVPLAVTGGWRSGASMAKALAAGKLDFVGLARTLVLEPDFPARLVSEGEVTVEVPPKKTGLGFIDRLGMAELLWFERQLHHMAHGKAPRVNESPLLAMLKHSLRQGPKALRRRRV